MDLRGLSVKQLSEKYLLRETDTPKEELELLRRDKRSGVRKIAATLHKRLAKARAEERRIEEMLSRERRLWNDGISYVAGLDEVGVGPFAGPVVAAAVIFTKGVFIKGIKDSKQLDHKKRLYLDQQIRRTAIGIGIGLVDVEEIDRLNIYNASLKAMRLALINLNMKAQRVLIDGRKVPDIGIPQEAITNGDQKVFSIAAASIIAKVHRDKIMIEYDKEFPEYGFAKHKGYGTAEHIMAIKIHGQSPIHRRSFDWQSSKSVAR
jgi:ribonuclease HII